MSDVWFWSWSWWWLVAEEGAADPGDGGGEHEDGGEDEGGGEGAEDDVFEVVAFHGLSCFWVHLVEPMRGVGKKRWGFGGLLGGEPGEDVVASVPDGAFPDFGGCGAGVFVTPVLQGCSGDCEEFRELFWCRERWEFRGDVFPTCRDGVVGGGWRDWCDACSCRSHAGTSSVA